MLFAYPQYLWLIIPILILLIILTRIDFVKIDSEFKENKQFVRRRNSLKIFVFCTRLIISILIILLIAKPYIELQTTEQGNPRVTILIDNSSSMSVFDLSFVDNLLKQINNQVPTTVRYIPSDITKSELGEEALRYMEKDNNILFISDLQVTGGLSLEDLSLFANTLNTTLSAIDLKSTKKDIGVTIEGDSRVIQGQEATFTIRINKLNMDEYNLLVSIDDDPVYNARDNRAKIEIKRTLEPGEHKITAKVLGQDDYSENNEFYKSVVVIPQPKVLYVSESNSVLPDVLSKVYSVTKLASVPSDLSSYYAVIMENMDADDITNVKALANFTEKGNGLFVIGGVNAYDRGNYKSSYFETLLPVRIGRGDKKQGDSSIVILIDMSGSTQNYWTQDSNGILVEVKDTKPLDVIKALAIDVIETLNMGNRVGVIAFAIQDVNDADKTKFKAVKVTDLDSLSNIKEKAVDKISRIAVPGQSLFDVGLAGAYTMLKHETGSRNVIMISDGGKNIYSVVKDNGLKNVQLMAEQGIRTYTVGVGRDERDVDVDYLKALAEAGNGNYFPAGQENRLKILFGTPEEKKQGDEMELYILNPTHFITRNLELDAKIYGFNQVVPKSLARVLVVTYPNNEPALVEWRYGLGKVISLTVFSGDAGLGQLLNQKNSKLLTNSINYLIGDPERKQEYNVIIPDTYINEITQVQVTSKEYPKASIELTKIKDNYYEGKLKPTQIGFSKEMNTLYAVNSPEEYQRLGMYSNAQKIIQSTGGKVFSKENPDQIAEYIKTVSKRSKIVKTYITWPLLVLLMIVYLFEVGLRKIIENRKTV